MGIKSKASQRKPRRWSFAITCNGKGFHIPVVCFGGRTKAKAIAEQIKENYSNEDVLKGKDFEVNLIPHETISLATQQQFDGLELEGRLLSRVAELIYDDLLVERSTVLRGADVEDVDAKRKAIGMYVVKAKASLMKEHYPEGAEVIEKSIARELAEDEESYRMPLGIDAVKEALNAPTEN